MMSAERLKSYIQLYVCKIFLTVIENCERLIELRLMLKFKRYIISYICIGKYLKTLNGKQIHTP